MALESVLIATLLFAHLTVKLELLKTLGLDAIPNVFRGPFLGLGHLGNDTDSSLLAGRR